MQTPSFMEKPSRKSSATEHLECNQFCRLDNNLINNIAAFVGNSKDILNLTQCSKDMKYVFQDAFLTASFGFSNDKQIRKVVKLIQEKNKINSLHFSNCRGIESSTLLDIIKEVNIHNRGQKDVISNERKREEDDGNTEYRILYTDSSSDILGKQYRLSSLFVEKCFSVKDDILYYLQEEENLSLDAVHLCDLNNVKLAYQQNPPRMSPYLKPNYFCIKVLGLTNSVFVIESLTNDDQFKNVLLREIINGKFPLLEALFLGGCKNFLVDEMDNRFLPLLNQNWPPIRQEIESDEGLTDSSLSIKNLSVCPRLRLIEHSFVDESHMNNFLSLVRIGQEIDYDITCRRMKYYRGMETLHEYLGYYSNSSHRYDETESNLNNSSENEDYNPLLSVGGNVVEDSLLQSVSEKDDGLRQMTSRSPFVYPRIILFDFYYSIWHERQNMNNDLQQRYVNEVNLIHYKNNSFRITTPEFLEASIKSNKQLNLISNYLRPSLQAATRSLDSRNQTILHKCASYSSDQTKALASWCLKQEIPVYAKDNKGNTILHVACDNGNIDNVHILFDFLRNMLYATKIAQCKNTFSNTYSSNVSDGHNSMSEEVKEQHIHFPEKGYPSLHIDGYQYISSPENKLGCKSNWISAYYRFHKNINLIKLKSHQGNTPLYLAALKGSDMIVASLLNFISDFKKLQDRGEDSSENSCIDKINLADYSDYEGYSPVHAAVIKGCLSTIKVLLEHPAVNEYSAILEVNRHDQNSLHLALRNGNMEIIDYLFQIVLNSENLNKNQMLEMSSKRSKFCLQSLINECMFEMRINSSVQQYLNNLAEKFNLKIDGKGNSKSTFLRRQYAKKKK